MISDVGMNIAMGTARFLAGAGLPDYGEYHKQINISPEEWTTLTSETLWFRQDAAVARIAIEKFINGALGLADMADDQVCAEYLATIVACVVNPVNWRVASRLVQTFGGEKLIASTGDIVASREHVAPDKLYTMILAYSNSVQFCARTEKVRSDAVQAAKQQEKSNG